VFLIVGIVLLLLLPSPWNIVGAACAFVLFLGELFFWNRKVRGQPQQVGAQNLIGQTATVIFTCRPDGQVRVSGEIWAARCPSGADQGATVRIIGLDELTLIVEPTAGEDERPDADIPQDPGIPGSKVPEQLPPQRKPRVRRVPDTGPPETDNEGHMTPPSR
jgi:membrane protein implicated in regulation of membrane protease activity